MVSWAHVVGQSVRSASAPDFRRCSRSLLTSQAGARNSIVACNVGDAVDDIHPASPHICYTTIPLFWYVFEYRLLHHQQYFLRWIMLSPFRASATLAESPLHQSNSQAQFREFAWLLFYAILPNSLVWRLALSANSMPSFCSWYFFRGRLLRSRPSPNPVQLGLHEQLNSIAFVFYCQKDHRHG